MGINVSQVSFKYNDLASKIINNVSLNINEKNEFIFLVGQTGSGKSTLVQLLNALLLPQSGNISVLNNDVVLRYKDKIVLGTKKNIQKYELKNKGLFIKVKEPIYNSSLKSIRQRIGLVFQFPEYQIFESTVLEDVAFGPKNYGLSKETALREAMYALRSVGLDKKYDSLSPFTLSGGQLRRVAIAGILACKPDVLILDEPTVGLDPAGKVELMDLLHHIQDETGKTIIVISHDMDIVAEHAKRVLVMNKGSLVFDGNKQELFNNEELLDKYNLDLPQISKTAKELKNRGLISYKNIPLTIKELEQIIVQGDKHE